MGMAGKPNLLKTKPCFDFQAGTCKRGIACTHSHGPADFSFGGGKGGGKPHGDLFRTKPCFDFEKGPCKRGAMCTHLHAGDKYKTKPCFEFEKTGSCKRGAACTHSHGDEEATA